MNAHNLNSRFVYDVVQGYIDQKGVSYLRKKSDADKHLYISSYRLLTKHQFIDIVNLSKIDQTFIWLVVKHASSGIAVIEFN